MNIGIIGAGPAGLMAAYSAKDKFNNVTILEKNEKIGKKLFITGKGRCNITNAKPMEEIRNNVISNNKFLYSAFNSFTNKDIIKLLKDYGLDTKVERGDRVFPVTDKSSDVLKAFNKMIVSKGIDLKLNTRVESIKYFNGYFQVKTDTEEKLSFDNLIIATGGVSYPATGSTGDGYEFSKELGHSIIDPKPALVGINLDDDFIQDLKGVSLRNVALNFKVKNKKHTYFGELLFTERGLSGPIALSASSFITKHLDNIKEMSLDLKPALDINTLDDRLIRELENNPNKEIKNIIEQMTIRSLIPFILKQASIDPDKKGNQITKHERSELSKIFKNFKVNFDGLDNIKFAIITSGGIKVKEINPSTMESKIIKNLYFAGEVIDVDALTGGYNLQIAYSTGYLAGISCKEAYNE